MEFVTTDKTVFKINNEEAEALLKAENIISELLFTAIEANRTITADGIPDISLNDLRKAVMLLTILQEYGSSNDGLELAFALNRKEI